MTDQLNVVDLKLDSLTRTVRVVAGVAPRVATRVGLGVVLAVDDAANDPAGSLLAIKLTEGAKSIASTVGAIAHASTDKLGSAATSIKGVVGSTVQRASSPEATAARAVTVAKLDKIPGLKAARTLAVQAASEVKETWSAAGYVSVEIVGECQADQEVPELAVESPTASSTTQI